MAYTEPMHSLGNIAFIANPASQNGKGAQSAAFAQERLESLVGAENVQVQLTQHARHATALAEQWGPRCDTLVVLGGDGIVHEAVNGLMRLPQEKRPVLGVIPVGSGNDYAASLGLSFKMEEAIAQLMCGRALQVDIGCCNGEYFTETLSFGFDAAIALDTMERRKRTGHKGTRLYLESGLDQLMHHLDSNAYRMEYVDAQGQWQKAQGSSHIFAVQMGRTYGGGFKICPKAKLDDGLLDICIAHARLSMPKATGIFLLAKDGHHTGFKCIESFQAQSITVEFDESPAVQIDGEPFPNTRFEVTLVPQALQVLTA